MCSERPKNDCWLKKIVNSLPNNISKISLKFKNLRGNINSDGPDQSQLSKWKSDKCNSLPFPKKPHLAKIIVVAFGILRLI